MKRMDELTVKQLKERAAALGIVGRSRMNKKELVNALLGVSFEHVVSDDEEVVNYNVQTTGIELASDRSKSTSEYVARLTGGELVAFKPSSRAVISGKVISISLNCSEVTIQTKAGSIHKVEPEAILWVRTGNRWPRWIFEMFGQGSAVCQKKLK